MASNLHFSAAARNAQLTAAMALIDAAGGHGTIQVRDGTQPGNTAGSTSGTVLLATFTLENPAFGSPASGVIGMDTTPVITATTVAAGTPTWARVLDNAGTAIFDGSVGLSACDFIISAVPVVSSQLVALSAGQFSLPA